MKTITEFQPLIFQTLIANSERRKVRRIQLLRALRRSLPVAYLIFGLWLILDTGFTPLEWPFWCVFGPLFLAGELALRELSQRRVL